MGKNYVIIIYKIKKDLREVIAMTDRSQAELNIMLANAIEQVKSAGFKVGQTDPNVYLTRATTQYGRCTKLPNGSFKISLSKFFKDNPEQEVIETLVHEVLHTLEGCQNHGVDWKASAFVMNQRFGYNITTTSSTPMARESEIAYKYVIKCTNCGSIIKRQKKSKLVTHTNEFKCKCGGKLELM